TTFDVIDAQLGDVRRYADLAEAGSHRAAQVVQPPWRQRLAGHHDNLCIQLELGGRPARERAITATPYVLTPFVGHGCKQVERTLRQGQFMRPPVLDALTTTSTPPPLSIL